MAAHGDVMELLQARYYDGIDSGDMERAAAACTDDIVWSHEQVWAHHEFERKEASALSGSAAILEFLTARKTQLAESGIQHKVRDLVVDGDRGAFVGYVLGPDGSEKEFMVWFELRDGLMSRYELRPL